MPCKDGRRYDEEGSHTDPRRPELVELCRILLDRDADAALLFLQHHLKGKARDLLEGG